MQQKLQQQVWVCICVDNAHTHTNGYASDKPYIKLAIDTGIKALYNGIIQIELRYSFLKEVIDRVVTRGVRVL